MVKKLMKKKGLIRQCRTFISTNRYLVQHILGTGQITERLAAMNDIYIPASISHREVFSKYENIYRGKTVVVMGSGPTLDYYAPIKDAIHIGVNKTIQKDDIKHAYLFLTDYNNKDISYQEAIINKKSVRKFCAYSYRGDNIIPKKIRDLNNVESYYVDGYDYSIRGPRFEVNTKFIFHPDLSVSPLKSYGTTLFCAFQFALWTHPSQIFLVGADCSIGHASNIGYPDEENHSSFEYLIRAWKYVRLFAKSYYPDIEIVSLNPVGLKGLFKDKYTFMNEG